MNFGRFIAFNPDISGQISKRTHSSCRKKNTQRLRFRNKLMESESFTFN
jgi:hypothetical protein